MEHNKNIVNVLFLLLLLTIVLPVEAERRALLIGLSWYPKFKQPSLNWPNIHGDNDVSLLDKILRNQGFKTSILTNERATAKNIRSALNILAQQTKVGDIVYIHFSGHGQPYEDRNGDEKDGWDEAIVPYDAGQRYIKGVYVGTNHIIDDEFNTYVSKIRRRAGRHGFVYVVIDACHAGGASRGPENDEDTVYVRGSNIGFSMSGKPFVPRINVQSTMRIPQGKNMAGTCYLEACRSYQTNCEIKVGRNYYGALSYYVNKTLAHHTLSSDSSWVNQVKKAMSMDKRLIRQNLVVEISVR